MKAVIKRAAMVACLPGSVVEITEAQLAALGDIAEVVAAEAPGEEAPQPAAKGGQKGKKKR